MSVGGLRQQFSLPENIEMSLFGADFLRNASRILHCEDVYTPDVNFQPHGYLFLASDEGVETMRENHYVQIECGAKVELLSAKQLKRKFPWLNTDGIAMGSYGYENEGWSKVRSLLEHSCAILISFKIVVIFNITSADFVLMSADVVLKMTTILKEMRIMQLCS